MTFQEHVNAGVAKLVSDRARIMEDVVRHLCGQPFSWDVFRQLSMECGPSQDTLFFSGTPIYRVRLETLRDERGDTSGFRVVGEHVPPTM